MIKYLHGLGLMVMWSTNPDWVISEGALRLREEGLEQQHGGLRLEERLACAQRSIVPALFRRPCPD